MKLLYHYSTVMCGSRHRSVSDNVSLYILVTDATLEMTMLYDSVLETQICLVAGQKPENHDENLLQFIVLTLQDLRRHGLGPRARSHCDLKYTSAAATVRA